MYCGQIVEEADVKTFFQSPKHPYTQALIQASPDPEKKIDQLMAIKGKVPSIENIPEGCRFAERCPHKTERCTKVEPKLYEQNDGTKVKCFLFEEGR